MIQREFAAYIVTEEFGITNQWEEHLLANIFSTSVQLGPPAIRWTKDRDAEDRLDVTAISDPDLGHGPGFRTS